MNAHLIRSPEKINHRCFRKFKRENIFLEVGTDNFFDKTLQEIFFYLKIHVS